MNCPAPNPEKVSAKDPQAQLWDDLINLLRPCFKDEPKTRTFVGKQVKEHGVDALRAGLKACQKTPSADPKSYLLGVLRGFKENPQQVRDSLHDPALLIPDCAKGGCRQCAESIKKLQNNEKKAMA